MKTIRISPKKMRSFYQSGYSVPLTRERKFSLSPWELYTRVFDESPFSFFLDSLEYRPPAQRYSYVGWNPYLRVTFHGEIANVGAPLCGRPNGSQLRVGGHAGPPLLSFEGETNRTIHHPDLLAELRKITKDIKIPPDFSSDFFTGGAVGYFGYELASQFEKISFRDKGGPSLPSLGLLYFRDLAVFDHKKESYYLISWLVPKKGISFERACRQAEIRMEEMKAAFQRPDPLSQNGRFQFEKFRPEISREKFERIVRKAKDYIRAGDIYQANLSQRFSFRFEGSALRLYESLRRTNPSPFAAALRFGDFFVASSSPELLLMKKGNLCVTRPIAGTRPRGWGAAETRRFSRELLTNEKERAEHLMLVDLERNDLGRVSEWRSVRVKDFMCLEKYARVIHIVSEITGKLRPGKDAWDVIQAMFPGGTITGCPKIRSMEIIDELEPVKRGIYTGSLGYVGFDGNAMLNIAIRTLLLQKGKGHLQVGAGIVADSDPAREYEETLHKGEALAEALIQASTE